MDCGVCSQQQYYFYIGARAPRVFGIKCLEVRTTSKTLTGSQNIISYECEDLEELIDSDRSLWQVGKLENFLNEFNIFLCIAIQTVNIELTN